MIVRVSRRERYLQAILDQLREIARTGLPVRVLFSYDRPSPQVCLTLEGIRNYKSGWFQGVDLQVFMKSAPAPVISPAGEHWMQVLQLQYEKLLYLAPECRGCMLWDDDQLFPPEALSELLAHFQSPPDRVEARSLFLWDAFHEHNAAFPPHWSAMFWRVYPGDRFPDDFVVNCPEFVARSTSCGRLSVPVVNFGYMTEIDRACAWGAQKEAGKIDAHTLCLQRPPRLEPVPANCILTPRRTSTRTLESF